jgi:hypothetical protein
MKSRRLMTDAAPQNELLSYNICLTMLAPDFY